MLNPDPRQGMPDPVTKVHLHSERITADHDTTHTVKKEVKGCDLNTHFVDINSHVEVV